MIGQAPGCSNRGNHIPLASPWRLGSFRGIKIFLGCAAAVGNIFHAYCRCLFGAPLPRKKSRRTTGPVPHILGIYIPFNKCLFGYKNRGIFLEKKCKKKCKNPAFFAGITSVHPNDPPSIKPALNGLIYSQGARFLQEKIPIRCTGICRVRGWVKTRRSAPTIPFS